MCCSYRSMMMRSKTRAAPVTLALICSLQGCPLCLAHQSTKQATMQANQQRVMHQGHIVPQMARMPICSRLAGTSAPAALRDVSARGLGSPEYDPARSFSSEDAVPFKRAEKQPLGLQFQSSRSASSMRNVVKTTGLHRAPLSGGVKTATLR